MKILLTNDDGITAAGLEALAAALEPHHDVWIVAPESQRSGASHAITMSSPGKFSRLSEKVYSCSGTPVDCIVLSGLGAIPFTPDLIVSGINQGPNLGTDIIFSGTCGAARQAALGGLPGIAVSCASHRGPWFYGAAASFVARHLETLLGHIRPGYFININSPSSDETDLPARWVFPGVNRYLDTLSSFTAPDGCTYHFLAGGGHEVREESDTDHSAIAAGAIAVSLIAVHPQAPRDFLPGPFLAVPPSQPA